MNIASELKDLIDKRTDDLIKVIKGNMGSLNVLDWENSYDFITGGYVIPVVEIIGIVNKVKLHRNLEILGFDLIIDYTPGSNSLRLIYTLHDRVTRY